MFKRKGGDPMHFFQSRLKENLHRLIFLFAFSQSFIFAYDYDLSVIGIAFYTEAIGRLSITSIDSLKNDLKLNFIPLNNFIVPDHIPPKILKIIESPDKSYGAVSLIYSLNDCLFSYESILKECNSKIKIIYTMIDSSCIPSQNVSLINEHFDAIVVPDLWQVETYQKAGINVPIFVLPCLIYLKKFLDQPVRMFKQHSQQPFIFGTSAAFVPRKNHLNLLEAFIQEFGNSPDVRLKLHGRWGSEEALRERVKQAGVTNVEIINKTMTQKEYDKFLTSLDCYAFLSKGEGYSITPREALACGIPCILSNNTAHTTLCNSGFVKAVPCPILEPASDCLDCCYFYNCKISAIRQALHQVYHAYPKYLEKALQGRKWVRQFDLRSLKPYYLSLVKPKRVILGHENKVGIDFLMTNSQTLFNKYQELLNQ